MGNPVGIGEGTNDVRVVRVATGTHNITRVLAVGSGIYNKDTDSFYRVLIPNTAIESLDDMIASSKVSSHLYASVVRQKYMTTAERDLLTVPSGESWLIYNTTTSQYEYYNGSAWLPVAGVPGLDAVLGAGNTSGTHSILLGNPTEDNTVSIGLKKLNTAGVEITPEKVKIGLAPSDTSVSVTDIEIEFTQAAGSLGIAAPPLTGSRLATLQDKTGVIAYLSDVAAASQSIYKVDGIITAGEHRIVTLPLTTSLAFTGAGGEIYIDDAEVGIKSIDSSFSDMTKDNILRIRTAQGIQIIGKNGVTILPEASIPAAGQVLTAKSAAGLVEWKDLSDGFVTLNTVQDITARKDFKAGLDTTEVNGVEIIKDGDSIGVGATILTNSTGVRSSGFGTGALHHNTGHYVNGVGFAALTSNTGSNSNGFGNASLESNTGESSNGFGVAALSINTGDNVSGFGNRALYGNKGDYNTAIGYDAGYSPDGAVSALTNVTLLGSRSLQTKSNQVTLGDTNVTEVVTNGDYVLRDGTRTITLKKPTLTASWEAELQDKSGTLAYLSDIGGGGASIQGEYKYTATLSGDPGAEKWASNNAVTASATEVRMSYTTNAGGASKNILLLLSVGDKIMIQDSGLSTTYNVYRVSAATTDNNAYISIPVTHIQGGSAEFTNNAVTFAVLLFSADVDEFVTINTEQDITARKDFKAGLDTTEVNGLPITIAGSNNIAIGEDALKALSSHVGGGGVAIGSSAMLDATNTTGSIAIGITAMSNNTTSFNVGIGPHCGGHNTGKEVVILGSETADNNGGDYAILVGSRTGYGNKGNDSIGIGRYSLYGNLANNVVGVGFRTLGSNKGANNTAMGYMAAYTTDVALNTLQNVTVLGASAVQTKSNQVTLGDTNVTEVVTDGDYVLRDGTRTITIKKPSLTNSWVAQLQDKSGTVAYLSDVTTASIPTINLDGATNQTYKDALALYPADTFVIVDIGFGSGVGNMTASGIEIVLSYKPFAGDLDTWFLSLHYDSTDLSAAMNMTFVEKSKLVDMNTVQTIAEVKTFEKGIIAKNTSSIEETKIERGVVTVTGLALAATTIIAGGDITNSVNRTAGNNHLGAGVSAGQVVYKASSGSFYYADASDESKISGLLCMATMIGSSGGDYDDILMTSGVQGGFTGLMPGVVYYVHPTTPAAITRDLSLFVSGTFKRRIGVADTSTELRFDPAQSYTEIA